MLFHIKSGYKKHKRRILCPQWTKEGRSHSASPNSTSPKTTKKYIFILKTLWNKIFHFLLWFWAFQLWKQVKNLNFFFLSNSQFFHMPKEKYFNQLYLDWGRCWKENKRKEKKTLKKQEICTSFLTSIKMTRRCDWYSEWRETFPPR